MRRLFILLIQGYQQFLSPLFGSRCCYYPSCSQYACDAIEMHGVIKGIWLAIKRISRCHPLSEGGVDKVPHNHNHNKSTPVKN